jgi:type I restriction-modification system DNA methylase subunit
MSKDIKRKKQDLGIFYTDQRIADFIFDILKIWKEKEEKEDGRWESRKHYPSVIDPAVGEGVFLKSAIETGLTKTEYIFGLDIDEEVVKKWKSVNLLKEFGGKEDDLVAHFFHQNGLDKIHWEQHIDKYRYKLKQKDISNQQFDAVIGNPPYGGVGLGETELTDDLVVQLANFEILPENIKNSLVFAKTQKDLFDSDKQLAIKLDAKQRIKSFAIEILFLERFIQLAKPGGWIAIIIPDGILTNSNSHYVREFVSEKTKVEAIVSLPRDAFKNVGTSAKTSVLFLQKYKDQGGKRDLNYPVFLASVESLEEKYFKIIKDAYQKHYIKI